MTYRSTLQSEYKSACNIEERAASKLNLIFNAQETRRDFSALDSARKELRMASDARYAAQQSLDGYLAS